LHYFLELGKADANIGRIKFHNCVKSLDSDKADDNISTIYFNIGGNIDIWRKLMPILA
jgi:hypothetical protein